MTQPKTNRIPAPVYAAAGAGELALEQLRKLPTVVSDLGTRVVADLSGKAVVTGVELRQKANTTLKTANLTAVGLREKAVPADLDLDKLREVATLDKIREAATRNAAAVLTGAQAAQARALAAYAELVARGERVVGAGVLEAADTVNADIEATEAAPVTEAAKPVEAPSPAEVAEAVASKPAAVKRTRATKATAAKAGATKPATPSAKLPKVTKRTRPAAE
ncbi:MULTISPECIES: hypothetical protein [Micromonospora]|uniref:Heparin binding hemagglutinin HbhA n=1 Tax=Micromonospora solifontis TaxID=2487138 RepID=A0ABX9WK41_9ACTN|nr:MULTISPECIES: hypothetical protein [Micromonospora]NES15663.1 hypothetical protein [Micromonospora sp. PPF5-17B]NES35963.1 hypothetical protein [Micromonospora solifontis]NES56964.1 hypothetical protein [Micromonospora sp. PPF5-6]RNM00071.1 hypothetical protein EFE23_07260 [Micromonospora solifontis]